MENALRRVTVRQVHSAKQEYTNADCTIDGKVVGKVVLVANIYEVREGEQGTDYGLDDGTGRIRARLWNGDNYFPLLRDHELESFATYVRVLGNIERYRERSSIAIEHIRLVSDPHEAFYHMLGSIVDSVTCERGPPPAPLAESTSAGADAKTLQLGEVEDDMAVEEMTHSLADTSLQSKDHHTPKPRTDHPEPAAQYSIPEPGLTGTPHASAAEYRHVASPVLASVDVSMASISVEHDRGTSKKLASSRTTPACESDGQRRASLSRSRFGAQPLPSSSRHIDRERPAASITSRQPRHSNNLCSRELPMPSPFESPHSSHRLNPHASSLLLSSAAKPQPRRRSRHDQYSDLTDLQLDVILFIRKYQHRATDTKGVSKVLIVNHTTRRKQCTAETVLEAIDFLIDEAHIYSALDDEHYAIT